MSETVLENYQVNQETMALLSIAHLDYDTYAIETKRTLYIRRTPLQLIKNACLEGGSTYEGRREAVAFQTGAKHKVPIPIYPHKQIYAFPTHSPKEFGCTWIFHNHVKSISPCSPKEQPKQTMITFRNNQQLTIPVSFYTIEKQIQRSSYCMNHFSNNIFEHRKVTEPEKTLSY